MLIDLSHANMQTMAETVAAPKAREGQDFFPLTVDYVEKFYSAGRIPGGFFKREGKPSEKEVLTSRCIDRPIRPLFAEGFRNETQVIAFVLSADQENDPDALSLVGAGAALHISDIPFPNAVAGVRVAYLDEKFIVNPTYDERREAERQRDEQEVVERRGRELEPREVDGRDGGPAHGSDDVTSGLPGRELEPGSW